MCSSTSTVFTRTRHRTAQRLSRSLLVIAISAGAVSACNRPAALTQLVEARRLASDLRVQFTHAADAANQAVMADTNDASTAAADEARRARQGVEKNVQILRPMLESLGYHDDIRHLDGFRSRFEEYRQLDDEILSLAVENTNVKAQRLSFGPAQEAADAFASSVDAAVRKSVAKDRCVAESIGSRARLAVLEVQVMQASHIPEADDAVMTRLEGKMTAAAVLASHALDELKGALSPDALRDLDAARAALARFMAVHREIITLSRRNSNVRSLALSLGRKRTVTAACEEQLEAFETALGRHTFNATR
jgi:hypothetical protein